MIQKMNLTTKKVLADCDAMGEGPESQTQSLGEQGIDTKWKAECTDNIIYRNTDMLYVQINRNSMTLDINER